jgi:hypothetical protein
MKLAEILSMNHEAISILERLNIKLGFADADVDEVCQKYNLSTSLFLMILNIYSFDNYQPNVADLSETDIPRIISYLRASHKYYTELFFPKLHQNIHLMVQNYDEVNKAVLNQFFDSYDAEVTKHFYYEENIVFPYIENLLIDNRQKMSDYQIGTFKKNHSNIDEKLQDLKNIIIKYIPESHSTPIRFEVLNNIFQIECDLKKHTMVENKLLIPLVSALEHHEK